MLPTATRPPLASPLTSNTLVASWEGDWCVHRLQTGTMVKSNIGRWLVRHGLYARGSDFTCAMAQGNPDYKGNSTLLDLWKGKVGSISENMAGLRIFVLTRRGVPQGVVAWLHADEPDKPMPWSWFNKTPDHPNHHPKQRVPVARLGHVMAFMKPAGRGQGMIKRTVSELIMPNLNCLAQDCLGQGLMPIIGASDAMERIVSQAGDLPVVEHLTVCRAMRDDVWSMLQEDRMYPERHNPSRPYLVAPQPVPKPAPKSRRRTIA